ncbi:MAG TPA: carbohydrate kinase family protein [Planctomycetota bacterium]|nr:carbohydrate kinase family protein [Planctomycetota bacterium]
MKRVKSAPSRRRRALITVPAHTPPIIVAGLICADLFPRFLSEQHATVGQLLVPGKLLQTRPLTLATGGSVANTGIALHKLGYKPTLMGTVGNDFLSAALEAKLRESGAEVLLRHDQQGSTSYTVILDIPGQDRIFLHHTGSNDRFTASDIDYGRVKKAVHFHFGYLPLMKKMYADSGKQAVAMYRRVKALGLTTSLDMTPPDPLSPAGQVNWPGLLKRLLPSVDLFPPSLEELLFCFDRRRFVELRRKNANIIASLHWTEIHGLAERVLALGATFCAVKCGERGLYFLSRAQPAPGLGKPRYTIHPTWFGRKIWSRPYNVPNFVSATGAGDCTIAALIGGLTSGQDLERTLDLASATGAICCTEATATGAIRPVAEIARWKQRRTKKMLAFRTKTNFDVL